jgi:DNA invertase Pin-like site-specific DNA recombinase
MMRLAAYLRVSTETQTEGLGLDVQETTIRAWATEHGHTIAATYTDAGISGSNGLDTRAALGDALAALKHGEAEGLVIYRLDRLARDLILQEQLLADIRRGGWTAFSTSDAEGQYLTDDPADPSRKMIRQVLGAVAEYERSMIALRLRAGRAKKASNGGFAGGAPPYGFRSSDGELVPVPDEQATLTRIRQLRGADKSYEQIAQALNADGIKSRRGGAWHRAVIARIV